MASDKIPSPSIPSGSHDPRFKNELPSSDSLSGYLDGYVASLGKAVGTVSKPALDQAMQALRDTLARRRRVFVAGNGGSAALADHLGCDWMKGTRLQHSHADTPHLRVQSLSANAAVLTAIANDYGYERSFSTQVEMLCEAGDLLVLISSSGNSENIVQAALLAKSRGVKVLGMTGFSGGRLRELADISLHVEMNNYGMVEDGHQILIHVLAQFFARERDIAARAEAGS